LAVSRSLPSSLSFFYTTRVDLNKPTAVSPTLLLSSRRQTRANSQQREFEIHIFAQLSIFLLRPGQSLRHRDSLQLEKKPERVGCQTRKSKLGQFQVFEPNRRRVELVEDEEEGRRKGREKRERGQLTSVLDLEDVKQDAEHEEHDSHPQDDSDPLFRWVSKGGDEVGEGDEGEGEDTV